jgi:DNA invertase Pin-like site-specific DNA recombinase
MPYKAISMNYDKQKQQWLKRREQARKMRDAGVPVVEIAKRMNIKRQRVYQILK